MDISDLKNYTYILPPELIRKEGVEPRDSARLFVYDTRTDTVTFDTFAHLAKYLPERSLMVLNDTKVLPARLWLKKETGGKIEVFVLANQIEDEKRIPVLVDRKTEVGQKLIFPTGEYFEVVGQDENMFFLELFTYGGRELSLLLDLFGETPLPHYLEGDEIPRQARNDREKELRKRYQTIFASAGASVAAPTASLHFTDEVFQSLDTKGIDAARLTLNVGLGTFAPLCKESFATGKLHAEYVDVSEETAEKINTAKDNNRSIVAVGTTVTRTLESLASESYNIRNREHSKTGDSKGKMPEKIAAYAGKTDIFIYPPYDFRVVDHLITNFHLPETSLMLLVEAFLGHKGSKRRIMDLYTIAIENKFAFYSFGDSMLIL
jgi:S-adenosylmethionine:tRNA ribosyltransferase-isomerase